MFDIYLKLGFQHILDLEGYDHILFIVALCAIYTIEQWKKILILVTAFTIGHSVTLALSALEIVVFPSDIIEFLIPLTIFITAIMNVTDKSKDQRMVRYNYFLALFFGFIHGLGFSNYFKALLGKTTGIVKPLFAFNIGVELGQLIIVACVIALGFVFVRLLKARQKDWNLFISGAAAGVSLILMLDKWPW